MAKPAADSGVLVMFGQTAVQHFLAGGTSLWHVATFKVRLVQHNILWSG